MDYVIKLVYPEWVVDPHRSQRIGFANKYRRQLQNWPVGGKMLVYLTDHQYLVAAMEVTGTLEQGERLDLPGHANFPLHLPVRILVENEQIVPLQQIKAIVPSFRPVKDLSYWPIARDQYLQLLEHLQNT